MAQTSAGGGAAEKRGNRFEMRWTVLNGAIPVLLGRAESITIEPLGELGDGIEFSVSRSDGEEVHQAKREYAKSGWTIHALEAEHVIDRLGHHLIEPRISAVFVSGTPARDLQGMTRKARDMNAAAWRADLTKSEATSADDLNRLWNVTDEEAVKRLRRLTIVTASEEHLALQAPLLMGRLVQGDEVAAAELLGGYLADTLHRPIRADELWTYLREHDHPPGDGIWDDALSERLREMTAVYCAGIDATRPARLQRLSRPEVDSAVAALTGAGPRRAVALVGSAGSGKSTIAAAVSERLREDGVVVATMRLDLLASTATAKALGEQAFEGFGGSATEVLRRAAGGGPAVLVIDQLDALSSVAGRGELIVEGVRQTLLQAGLTQNIRVLIACREHDLKHDRALQQLLRAAADPELTEPESVPCQIPIGDLNEEELTAALNSLGIQFGHVNPRLRSILRNFFNLSLLARLVESAEDEGRQLVLDVLRTRLDLLRAVDEHFANRIFTVTGDSDFGSVVQRLALQMSDSGRLSLPDATTLSARVPVRNALLTEGVLVRDSGQIRFFHQAYFEYCFAQGHVGQGLMAIDLVRDDLQDVLRRGQVRSILALEREAESSVYAEDARRLLFDPRIRTHIRSSVIDLIADQLEPLPEEITLLREVASTSDHPTRFRATRSLSVFGPAHYLGTHGLIDRISRDVRNLLEEATSEGEAPWLEIEAEEQLWLLENLARTLPEVVSKGVRPLAANPILASRITMDLLRVVFLAGSGAGAETAALYVALTQTLGGLVRACEAEELPDRLGGSINLVFNTDGLHALHTIAVRNPTGAIDVLEAWLSLAFEVAAHAGAVNPFDGHGSVIPHNMTGLDSLGRMVEGAPLKFVHSITPLLLAAMDASRRAYGHSPAGEVVSAVLYFDDVWAHGSPYLPEHSSDELLAALIRALQAVIQIDPTPVLATLEQLIATDLLTAHATAAAAFSHAPSELMDKALEWARRLESRGVGLAGTTSWSWGSVLARVVEVGDYEQRALATTLALEPYCDLDLEIARAATYGGAEGDWSQRIRAHEQHAAAALVKRAWESAGLPIPEELSERVANLDEVFGAAPTQPGPLFYAAHVVAAFTDEQARALSDEEWLSLVNSASEASEHETPDPFAADTLTPLRGRAQEEPGRFARLLVQMQPAAATQFAGTVLFGIAQSTAETFEDARADVMAAVRFAWTLQDRASQELCLVIQRLSKDQLPADILEMVVWIATESPDPDTEVWKTATPSGDIYYGGDIVSSGLNCVRGQGVIAITQLLRGPHGETHLADLQSALPRIIADPVEQVRVLLPDALVALMRHDSARAAELLLEWLARATDDGLKAQNLANLAYRIGFDRGDDAEEVAKRMLGATIDSVRNTGGHLATYLAWRDQERDPDHEASSALLASALADPHARAGVAFAVAELRDSLRDDLTVPLTDPPRVGWSLLIRLLDDPDDQVRSNARNFAHRIEQSLDNYEGLLAAVAGIEHFDDLASSIFFTAKGHPGKLPEPLLAMAERWVAEQRYDAGDKTTSASGTAMYLTDLVFDIHAQSERGSDMRRRCLDVFDRLIELGADDIIGVLNKAEE